MPKISTNITKEVNFNNDLSGYGLPWYDSKYKNRILINVEGYIFDKNFQSLVIEQLRQYQGAIPEECIFTDLYGDLVNDSINVVTTNNHRISIFVYYNLEKDVEKNYNSVW